MGATSDRLFKHKYYKAVCHCFAEAITHYDKGFKQFTKQLQSYDLKSYQFKVLVYEKFSDIKNYDTIIHNAESLRSSYPRGVLEFQDRIQYPERNDDFVILSQIVQHEWEIIQFEHYVVKKSQYPLSISASLGDTPTADQIASLLSTVSGNSFQLMEEYLSAKNNCESEFLSIFNALGVTPITGDFSQENLGIISSVLSQHAENIRISEIQSQFHELVRDCSAPVTLLYGKKPQDFSLEEKESAINRAEEIRLIQEQYFEATRFRDETYHNYLSTLVRNAEEGRIYLLPQYSEDLTLVVNFNNEIVSRPRRLIEAIISGIPDYDDLSCEAIDARRKFMSYLQLNYGDDYQSIWDLPGRLESDRAERSALLASIFNSTFYGTNVNFPEDYSIQNCYQLIQQIEACNTTFDSCYEYIMGNLSRIKEYNRIHSGRAVWYISDLVKVAQRDEDLLNYIEEANRREEITREIQAIRDSYPIGYRIYATNHSIPAIGEASLSQLDSVLENRDEIERLEFLEKARDLISSYPDAAKSKFGADAVMRVRCTSDFNLARQIVESEEELIALQNQIIERREYEERITHATSGWGNIAGDIPHYFFYWYYPSRFSVISGDSEYARNLIYRFKDGDEHEAVVSMVEAKIRSTFDVSDILSFSFVCIPASTREKNNNRYRSFSSSVCSRLGMRNGFNHISITRERTASHLGGTESAEYSFDEGFFAGAHVILFDDVVTRGRSMRDFKAKLHSMGASVVCAISIGRTYSDYYGDNHQPHPWLHDTANSHQSIGSHPVNIEYDDSDELPF